MTNYWLCLFTGTSWSQFLNAQSKQVGFNKTQIKQAQKIKTPNLLLLNINYLLKNIDAVAFSGEVNPNISNVRILSE
ncbi:hypothetical protein OAY88_02170 [Alphaproteobacteria bacterium]|nr:hypothetical protein [Alphaproteobacteria bacterium]